MPGPNPSITKMRSGQNRIAGGGTHFIVQATNADGANPQGAGAFVQLAMNPFI